METEKVMIYEVKRSRLVGALWLAYTGIVVLSLIGIGFYYVLVVDRLPSISILFPILILAVILLHILLGQVLLWQKIIRTRNGVWRISINEREISLDTLQEQKRFLWQQLAKFEKQFLSATGDFVYKLETTDGMKLYIPSDIDPSGAMIEQIKTFANKANARTTFVLPERLIIPRRQKIILWALLAIIVLIAGCISLWVTSQISHGNKL